MVKAQKSTKFPFICISTTSVDNFVDQAKISGKTSGLKPFQTDCTKINLKYFYI